MYSRFADHKLMTTDMLSESDATPAAGTSPQPMSTRTALTRVVVWRLNMRLAIWTLAAAIVVAPCLFFWYSFQVQRHATFILAHARTLHEQGNWKSAATAFRQYLQLRPQDAEAILLRAQNFDKLNDQPDQRQRAVSLYFDAIRMNPGRHDVRLRLAELLFEAGRYEDAANQAREAAAALPDEVKAARILAKSLREQLGPARRHEAGEVVRAFEQGLARHKGDIQLSIGLAELLRKFQDARSGEARDSAIATADRVIDDMISQHPNEAEAHLARYRYRSAYQLDGGAEDLAHARQAAPDNPDVLLASAVAAGTSDRPAARAFGEHLLEVASNNRRAYMTVAELYTRWNEPQDAIRVLEAGAARIGRDDLELNRALLQVAMSTQNVELARATLARIEPVFGRIEPYLPDAARRRFNEDLDVAKAQLQILEGNVLAALPALKRLAASVTESADPADTMAERQRRWRLLATAYARQGMHDRAAATFDELVRLDPRVKENHLLAANEWRLIGDYERAINHYDLAVTGETDLPAAWLGLAETRLDQQLRKPASEGREWTAVDAALKQAQARLGDAAEVLNLRAIVAVAKNDRQAALDCLRELLAKDDLDLAMLPKIASLLQDAGAPAEAAATLERYRQSGGSGELAALTTAELLRRRGDFSAAVRTLEQALSQTPESARGAVLRQLIAMEIDAGAMQSARQRLLELRNAHSLDLWVYETAVDLALMAGDHADLRECERQLKPVEGPAGTLWRFIQAVQLLESSKDEVPDAVRRANKLVGEIETARPSWPLARVLRGRVAESQGHLSDACDLYEQALRSGARTLTTFQWLVSALYRQNRLADAAAYIGQSGQMAATSGEFASQAIPASLRAGRVDDALRMARAAAELRPADPSAQVWHAQTLTLAGKPDAALLAFRKALELAPQDSRAWSALVWFHAHEQRLPEARQVLQDMIAKVQMSEFERELVLARGSDLIGDHLIAEQHYRKAVAGHEKDVKLLEEIGRFYLRTDQEKALDAFQRVLAVDPNSAEARRSLALLLGTRGSDAEWNRAIGLLDANDKSTAADDQRLQATLLLLRGGTENAKQGVDLLTQLVNRQGQARPGDRLLLARAFEELDQLDEARKQYEAALKQGEPPAYLALYIEFLNRHSMIEEAGRKLSRLEEKAPGHPRLLELRVNWLNISKRSTEIETTVDRALAPRIEAAKNIGQKVALLRAAADLLTRVKLDQAVEKKLRQIAAIETDGYGPLAVWLAERSRLDESLAIIVEKAASADIPRKALLIVRVLTVAASRGDPKPTNSAAAEQVFATAFSSHPNATLLFETGVLRIMQGRNADAISLYERALAKDPENLSILNNLAIALSEIPDRRAEALRLIDKALVQLPASTEMLDSKALVLMNAGRIQEAQDILTRICRMNRKNPRFRLHLAAVLFHMQEGNSSRNEVERAVIDGLENELLTPAERRQWRQITNQVAEISTK
jgi:tetratricopeptide (TPR) repeat protein